MQSRETWTLSIKFTCVMCGDTHHEQWNDEFPENFEDCRPRTLVNWDGTPLETGMVT
jgi:hypothetical protein